MVVFPNAKINLGLRVVAKRSDGYHDIDTVFYPIPFFDILEIIPSNKDVEFTFSGKEIIGNINSNLCYKAYQLIKKDYPQIPSVKIHLHKNIPMGAGLGGGSSDGAFMLKILNEKFQLGITGDVLEHYALQLGSDCPFFIANKACGASGRGEQFESIELDLKNKSFLLVNPGLHVSTADAFSKINIANNISPCTSVVKYPIYKWKELLINDFEHSVFEIHPILKEIKETLYSAGAVYASMTGTGSSIYGIFEKDIPENLFPQASFEIIKIINGKAIL
jgi:4-diphosphocytidyl-2-C-methyl-D-erythritol kinase